jgi:hypothetical protein
MTLCTEDLAPGSGNVTPGTDDIAHGAGDDALITVKKNFIIQK